MSLSGRPGNFGTRFHNFLYDALGLDYLYKAFTTSDLAAAIGGIRALGIRGCAISMPFKIACIPLLDELEASASAIGAVNTILNDGGRLRGFNTDYSAVRRLLDRHAVASTADFALAGSGGMARAVAGALRDAGYRFGTVVARNAETGPELAAAYGYEWRPAIGDLRPKMLINVTPVGMSGGADAHELAFPAPAIDACDVAFDVVAVPVATPFLQRARADGKRIISGADVIVLQALGQFVLYTGVTPPPEVVSEAARVALAAR